ncbi:MAG: methyl-accepting chemotaxis protein [Spirochaetaceae bacterium]|nr:methyl-accepting chemotaxis protein [Spirochaetaceae bacterium]
MKKVKVSLQTQFIAFFSGAIVVICGLLTFLGLRESAEIAIGIFSKDGAALSTEIVTVVIDGDRFETLARNPVSNDRYFIQLQKALYEKQTSSTALFLYAVAPINGDSGGTAWHYVADGSDVPGGQDYSEPGTVVDTTFYGQAFKRALQTGASEHSQIDMDVETGLDLVTIFTPVKNSRGAVVGAIGCDFDARDLNRDIRLQAVRQIGVALVLGAIAIVITAIFLRGIFRRIFSMSTILQGLSEGDGDLTPRITANRMDEIGILASYFNLTLDKIKHMIITVKEMTVKLSGMGNDLSTSMAETAAAVNEIAANIQSIKNQAINQSASVTETGSTMEQVTLNIEKLNKHVEDQAASVSQSSSAIEEMLANIQSVTQTLQRNEKNVSHLATASDVGRTGLEEVSADIQEIARESAGLIEINSVIKNIASQTNLLAMNAAIEAAHAGEAGKGFAVVADEIRKLAENAAEQSKTISGVLKKITESIEKITKSTGTVLEKFQDIDDQVKTVANQEAQIRTAMEEQGAGSQQILDAIGRLNGITGQVKNSSREMLEGSQEVIRESQNLEKVTQEITSGVNEMATGADQINVSINQVNNLSGSNRQLVETLVQEMAKFKVE